MPLTSVAELPTLLLESDVRSPIKQHVPDIALYGIVETAQGYVSVFGQANAMARNRIGVCNR
jgi:hypothetical protein